MSMKATVKRTVHVDMNRALLNSKKIATKEGLELGVKRARYYVAKKTRSLMNSIQKLNQFSYGVIGSRLASRNKRDYSAYQEGERPTNTKFTPYLKPSAEDVARSMPGIIKKALRRSM